MKQTDIDTMTDQEYTDIISNLAGAAYDWWSHGWGQCDVVLSPDGKATAISPGADYPWVRIWENLEPGDFGDCSVNPEDHNDYRTRDQFVNDVLLLTDLWPERGLIEEALLADDLDTIA